MHREDHRDGWQFLAHELHESFELLPVWASFVVMTLPGNPLPIMETFYTLQGEGAFVGSPAYFIRVGGCDVGCVWCDVKESWDADSHPKLDVSDVVDEAATYPARIAVVTGGEPLMYDMGPLTSALRSAGFRTHLETSGAYPISGEWHWICFSPKKFKKPVEGIHEKAHELKVIVANKHDLKWALEHAANVSASCAKYLQPEWDKADQVTPMILEFVKEHPEWRVSLQTHKYLDIP